MFEISEVQVLTRQLNSVLPGKVVASGELSNSPHKFVWHNLSQEEFAARTRGKTAGQAYSRGRWLFIPLEPGDVLTLGEFGGKLLLHAPGAAPLAKRHLLLTFTDGSALSALTQMWGAYELYARGAELERQYIKDMRPAPLEAAFTYEYFSGLIDSLKEKRPAKGLLTQDQLIPGLGNAVAQDILFRAKLHPRHPVNGLEAARRAALYEAIQGVVSEIIAEGGRYDETDLFGNPGGYVRLMDNARAGQPCPECGAVVEKIQYLGGACYFCPECQKLG